MSSGDIQGKPKGKPRGFRRDRDCTSCKARNIKCDLNRPACGKCKEDGLQCDGYHFNVRWIGERDKAGKRAQMPSIHNPPQRSLPGPSRIHVQNGLRNQEHTSIPSPAERVSSLATKEHTSNWTVSSASYVTYFMEKLDQARSSHTARTSGLTTCDTEDLYVIWEYAWKHIEYTLWSGKYVDVDHELLHTAALNALSRVVRAGHVFAIFGITTFAYMDVKEGAFGDW
jgi:hypothetical protein